MPDQMLWHSRQRVLSIAAREVRVRQAVDLVAHAEVGDVRADGVDSARHIGTQDQRQGLRYSASALANECIPRPRPGSAPPDSQRTRPGFRAIDAVS